jgi:hypothetical protein
LPSFTSLYRAIDAAYRGALQFYRAKRGTGERAQDISTFFKRRGLHRDFERFWRSSGNTHRGRFRKAWKGFERKFSQEVNQ